MSHLEITTGLFVLFLVYTSRFQSLKGLFHQIFLHMSTPLFLAGSFHNFFPHMSHILIFSCRFIYSHAVLLCRNAGYKNPASGSPGSYSPSSDPTAHSRYLYTSSEPSCHCLSVPFTGTSYIP